MLLSGTITGTTDELVVYFTQLLLLNPKKDGMFVEEILRCLREHDKKGHDRATDLALILGQGLGTFIQDTGTLTASSQEELFMLQFLTETQNVQQQTVYTYTYSYQNYRG